MDILTLQIKLQTQNNDINQNDCHKKIPFECKFNDVDVRDLLIR